MVFVKIFRESNGFTTGLNIDPLPWDISSSCFYSGFYYTTIEHIFDYIYLYSDPDRVLIAEIEIPDDAKVHAKEKMWKADKIIIKEFIPLENYLIPEEICMAAVQEYGLALQYVKKQSPEICMAAVQEHAIALLAVEEQTPEICMVAVMKNGLALQWVKKQSPEICMEAVQEDASALQYVEEQTPEICLAAVQRYGHGWTLKYVKKQSPEICMAAVQNAGEALEYVEEQSPEICMAAVQQDESALQYVEEICMAAVEDFLRTRTHVVCNI